MPCNLWALSVHSFNGIRSAYGGHAGDQSYELHDWSNARYYDLPWRTSNTLGGAKTLDAQAGYESTSTMMGVLLAGGHYIWHSAGWNEAGMHCSVAKFVVDAEQCEMGYRMAEGICWDDFEEAIEAVSDVGPGGHYLGHLHTLMNFQNAFFFAKVI